jgi:hypothetical protein
LVDYRFGIEIVDLVNVKTKLSYKDFLLLVGVLVAVIIALTTWVYTENLPEATQMTPPSKKSSLMANPSAVVQKLLDHVGKTPLAHKPSVSR